MKTTKLLQGLCVMGSAMLIPGLAHSAANCTGYDSLVSIYTETADPTRTVYGWRGDKNASRKCTLAHQIGRPGTMEELIRRLLGAVRDLSPYKLDVEMPAVHRMPLAELHRRLCGRPCTIRAAYVPGEGLYMDEMMRPLNNQYDQSIVFHELVHYVQDVAVSHHSDDECQRWRKREFEAYALQNQFLFALDSSARALWPGKFCTKADDKLLAPEASCCRANA